MPQAQLGFGQLLQQQRDVIVSRFAAEIQRKGLVSPEVPRPLLVDHIPMFLDRVAEQLSRSHGTSSVLSGDHPSASAGPASSEIERATSFAGAQHGTERWRLGYNLKGLIREYGILRESIMHTANEA